MAVQFAPPDIHDEDIEAVVNVLKSGWITSGSVARDFESRLKEATESGGAVVTNSCTAALELSLRVLGIGPGDEVIVPAYTYTASAAVINHVGAKIVLVDSAENSYFPSIASIVSAITENTKAIIVVDLAGVPFETDELMSTIAGTYPGGGSGLPSALGRPVVIVDAAHSLGATRGGKTTGSIGDFTCFSFHAVKNLTTAEGGALLWRKELPWDANELEQRIRRYALHGQSKDALSKMKAGSWEYDVTELGYKFNMPDVLAAMGLSQFERYPTMLEKRLTLVQKYNELLAPDLSPLAHIGKRYRSSAHLFMVNLGEHSVHRNKIIEHMAQNGIATNVHYKPLPMLTAYRELGFNDADFPFAIKHFQGEISLPLHTGMSVSDVKEVTDNLNSLIARLAV